MPNWTPRRDISSRIRRDGHVAAIFASAVSQSEFLETLGEDGRIDWSVVKGFHMDEYIGIGPDHPASFRRFQHERMWSRVTRGHLASKNDGSGRCASR